MRPVKLWRPKLDGSRYATPNFSWAELTVTQTGLPNHPTEYHHSTALRLTAQNMEVVRKFLGDRPIRITSGWRSSAVNTAVGGSDTSDHMEGHAVDFTHADLSPQTVFQKIAKSWIGFDQLIGYKNMNHISFAPTMRREHWRAS